MTLVNEPTARFLGDSGRHRRSLCHGLITPAEFANWLLSSLAGQAVLSTEVDLRVIEAIPEEAREAIREVSKDVLNGDVRGPTFRIGPGMTTAEVAQLTPKLQACAAALLEQLRDS